MPTQLATPITALTDHIYEVVTFLHVVSRNLILQRVDQRISTDLDACTFDQLRIDLKLSAVEED